MSRIEIHNFNIKDNNIKTHTWITGVYVIMSRIEILPEHNTSLTK